MVVISDNMFTIQCFGWAEGDSRDRRQPVTQGSLSLSLSLLISCSLSIILTREYLIRFILRTASHLLQIPTVTWKCTVSASAYNPNLIANSNTRDSRWLTIFTFKLALKNIISNPYLRVISFLGACSVKNAAYDTIKTGGWNFGEKNLYFDPGEKLFSFSTATYLRFYFGVLL
jgi:hypothetical protein